MTPHNNPLSISSGYLLNNGILIPRLGYGTYKTGSPEECAAAVSEAIATGYRLIDCAASYGNEKSVGEALRASGLPRCDLFVCSKVANTERGYDSTLRAFERTLDDLGLTYLDLYLIHWPVTPAQSPDWRNINDKTWQALERLMSEGAVRSIGVSNFTLPYLEPLLLKARRLPVVNQLEYNPGTTQPETVGFCEARNIRIEAWSPLGRQRIFDNETLRRIAEAHGRTVAQVCLRWEMQNGVIPIPKSSNPDRIRQNADIFDFELTAAEMRTIDLLPPFGGSGLAPETITF